MNALLKSAFAFVLVLAGVLQSQADETNGLYTISSGKKSDIQVLHADVYAQDNANTRFAANLSTSPFQEDPQTHEITNPAILRIGGHDYSCTGWGGSGWSGPKAGAIYNMFFDVTNQDDAQAAAKLFSATCHLRSPPGYKMLAEFVPSKAAFKTNEPVIVTFRLKNMDERTIIFPQDAKDSDIRDEQYGFLATLYGRPLPDINGEDWSRPISRFEGLSTLISLAPGKVFEDQMDLKNWFAFNKAGEYTVHGFRRLDFYPPPVSDNTFMPWNELWQDYASADFTVVVK